MSDSGTADSTTAVLWLHMLSHGGRWTSAELAVVVGWGRDRTNGLLADMAVKGFCLIYRSGQRKNGRAYGVGMTCKVPRGVRIDQVMEAARVPMSRPKDDPLESESLPPRGQLAGLGRVTSVFALGSVRLAATTATLSPST